MKNAHPHSRMGRLLLPLVVALLSLMTAYAASQRHPKGRATPVDRYSRDGEYGRPRRDTRERRSRRDPHDNRGSGGGVAREGDRGLSSRSRSRPVPSRSKPSSSSRYDERDSYGRKDRRGHSGGRALVPTRSRPPPKPSVFSSLASTVKDKAAAMQEDAKGKVMEWKKIAKGKFSSHFERFMLQMTWPDDNAVDETFVKDLMHYLDTADDYPDVRSPNNPYKRTLRKLWSRIAEDDYRTKLKALVLLHHMSTDLSVAASIRVRNHLMRMRDETNLKNRNEVYFEQSRISDVSSTGIPFLPLLKSYGSFTFRRMVEVKGGPGQVLATLKSKKTTQAEAVTLLRRLDKLICHGTGCRVDRKTMCKITADVIRFTANDTMIMWRLYVKGLNKLVKEEYKQDKAVDPEAVKQLVAHHAVTREILQKYLKTFRMIVKDQSIFEENQVDTAALEAFTIGFSSNKDMEGEGDGNREIDAEECEELEEEDQKGTEGVCEEDEEINKEASEEYEHEDEEEEDEYDEDEDSDYD